MMDRFAKRSEGGTNVEAVRELARQKRYEEDLAFLGIDAEAREEWEQSMRDQGLEPESIASYDVMQKHFWDEVNSLEGQGWKIAPSNNPGVNVGQPIPNREVAHGFHDVPPAEGDFRSVLQTHAKAVSWGDMDYMVHEGRIELEGYDVQVQQVQDGKWVDVE